MVLTASHDTRLFDPLQPDYYQQAGLCGFQKFFDPPKPKPPKKENVSQGQRLLDKLLRLKCPTSSDLATVAFHLGLDSASIRLGKCCTDFLILRHPDTGLTAKNLPCGHRLCPTCTKEKSKALASRVAVIAPQARSFVTLTIPTKKEDDWQLYWHLKILARALRNLTQSKGGRSKNWLPFGDGYLWKLEVTDGLGFHPHAHILTTEGFISHKRLTTAWAKALRRASGFVRLHWFDLHKRDRPVGVHPPRVAPNYGHVLIQKIDAGAIKEMSKYFSKPLHLIHPDRWEELLDGLHRRRLYGSGGDLKIPSLTPAPAGMEVLGIASKLRRENVDPEVRKLIDFLYKDN